MGVASPLMEFNAFLVSRLPWPHAGPESLVPLQAYASLCLQEAGTAHLQIPHEEMIWEATFTLCAKMISTDGKHIIPPKWRHLGKPRLPRLPGPFPQSIKGLLPEPLSHWCWSPVF